MCGIRLEISGRHFKQRRIDRRNTYPSDFVEARTQFNPVN
ncbi:hypothetical protein Mal64_09010 [Pseudobythopirellula maris]|uniref:Uncharacterized protein n=1 Tax=Pseudobythopirellula maris TaxID=2527991 RepID=A0A5C5ZTD8_9BACT|nr:hypothetical protein Mal64_09010 [Pseudobythopirellula maris]